MGYSLHQLLRYMAAHSGWHLLLPVRVVAPALQGCVIAGAYLAAEAPGELKMAVLLGVPSARRGLCLRYGCVCRSSHQKAVLCAPQGQKRQGCYLMARRWAGELPRVGRALCSGFPRRQVGGVRLPVLPCGVFAFFWQEAPNAVSASCNVQDVSVQYEAVASATHIAVAARATWQHVVAVAVSPLIWQQGCKGWLRLRQPASVWFGVVAGYGFLLEPFGVSRGGGVRQREGYVHVSLLG